jgi:hypothetical protein
MPNADKRAAVSRTRASSFRKASSGIGAQIVPFGCELQDGVLHKESCSSADPTDRADVWLRRDRAATTKSKASLAPLAMAMAP